MHIPFSKALDQLHLKKINSGVIISAMLLKQTDILAWLERFKKGWIG